MSEEQGKTSPDLGRDEYETVRDFGPPTVVLHLDDPRAVARQCRAWVRGVKVNLVMLGRTLEAMHGQFDAEAAYVDWLGECDLDVRTASNYRAAARALSGFAESLSAAFSMEALYRIGSSKQIAAVKDAAIQEAKQGGRVGLARVLELEKTLAPKPEAKPEPEASTPAAPEPEKSDEHGPPVEQSGSTPDPVMGAVPASTEPDTQAAAPEPSAAPVTPEAAPDEPLQDASLPREEPAANANEAADGVGPPLEEYAPAALSLDAVDTATLLLELGRREASDRNFIVSTILECERNTHVDAGALLGVACRLVNDVTAYHGIAYEDGLDDGDATAWRSLEPVQEVRPAAPESAGGADPDAVVVHHLRAAVLAATGRPDFDLSLMPETRSDAVELLRSFQALINRLLQRANAIPALSTNAAAHGLSTAVMQRGRHEFTRRFLKIQAEIAAAEATGTEAPPTLTFAAFLPGWRAACLLAQKEGGKLSAGVPRPNRKKKARVEAIRAHVEEELKGQMHIDAVIGGAVDPDSDRAAQASEENADAR